TAGFVIVGMFVVVWAGAMIVWRVGRIEERWGARLIAQSEVEIERDERGLDSPNQELEASLREILELPSHQED
ncbi:MAG: hypothetical protein WAN30_03805, partial [Acidimicrobiales bacterium]